jgi:hypothetical protein
MLWWGTRAGPAAHGSAAVASRRACSSVAPLASAPPHRATHWHARVARGFFLAAAGYLVLVCVLGGVLAGALRWNLVHADLLPVHAVTALLGWATILAMGAAYRLTPRFAPA